MSISSIGVGSGLPLEELLADLRRSESSNLALIQAKQTATKSRISAYGSLKAAIEQLQKTGQALETPSSLSTLKASVSGDGVFASITGTPIEGQYSIKISSLASRQTLVSQGVSSRTDTIGDGGVITFTLGDGSQKTLDLTGKDTSINGLIAAINGQADLGIRATVLNDGQNTPHRLMLSTTETGTAAAITSISVSGNSDPENHLQQLLGFGSNAPDSTLLETAASDALVSINGIAISSPSNTIKHDTIEGVSLTLTASTPDALTLTVGRDDAASKKAITAFVDAYNHLQKTIQSLGSYNAETQKSSTLTGDALLRRVQTQMRETLHTNAAGSPFSTLSALGISTDPGSGQLKIDDAVLTKVLAENPNEVHQLFTQNGNGIGAKVAAATSSFLRTGGLLDSVADSATRQLADLQKQYETGQQRIDARIEAYRRQFTSLDSMVTQMNTVSTYLTQQLSMLGKKNDQ